MKPEKVLDDVVQSAIGAKAHLDVCWAQMSEARPRFNQTMGKYHHFFRASRDAHYMAFFTYFARLFDRRSDSSSISAYLSIAPGLTPETLSAYRDRLAALKIRAKPLLIARHTTVAHTNALLDEKEVFLKLKVRWDDIRAVIDDACEFVMELADAKHPGDIGIPEGRGLIDATLRVINDLSKIK